MIRRFGSDLFKARFAPAFGWVLLIYTIYKHVSGPIVTGEAWQTWLPLHMCHLSTLLMAYALISGKRAVLIEITYFWTFAGASMALVTPDLQYVWPDYNYILYMITHGLLLMAAFYFVIVEGIRPMAGSIWKVLKISVAVMLPIIPLNYLIGHGANYFYLRFPPVVGSLMDYLPAPPLHIPFFIALAYAAFWLVYLPFWIKDQLNQKMPASEERLEIAD